jgi:tetratricopeptide (TPR) repeat protein
MGLAAALFGHRAEQPHTHAGPADWMAYGKREFFVGRTKTALKAFARAADAAPGDPLPLAYRSWAGRLLRKSRALADAERAVALDPDCAEAQLSLGLAHGTHPVRAADCDTALAAVGRARELTPADAYGSVLSIGVHLLFADASAAAPDETAFALDFPSTPLGMAADWLLSGRHVAALDAFEQIADSGSGLMSALGLAATYWAMRDMRAARNYSAGVLESGSVKHRGIRHAVGIIATVSSH